MDFDIYKTCPRGTDLPANKTRENRLWSRPSDPMTVVVYLFIAIGLVAAIALAVVLL